MNLSISNIAWDVKSDVAVADILLESGVTHIDVAPGKYFPDPCVTSAVQIEKVRRFWSDKGIRIFGMQALLFGTQGLNIFGNATIQNTMLRHLTHVCRIASALGATRLVFGSPKNRDLTGVEVGQVVPMAVEFFRKLGDRARQYDVVICIEPNPQAYGCNFMLDSKSTAEVVRLTAHPSIMMQFDTGAVLLNKEDPDALLAAHSDIIGHVHLSEPALLPLGDTPHCHQAIARSLRSRLPASRMCIEMLATQTEPQLQAIKRALQAAVNMYGLADGHAAASKKMQQGVNHV